MNNTALNTSTWTTTTTTTTTTKTPKFEHVGDFTFLSVFADFV